jgi:hypothetical protein
MTYSPLTDEVMPPTGTYRGGKKWSARPAGVRINGLNVHHHAATSDAGINRLVTSDDPASANYIIRTNGSLIGSVPEEYRAWTTSAYANDDDKITVEVQNETGAPEWRISAAAMLTLIRLYADLAKRHGFAPTRANIYGHRDYAATACPGPYLYPRLGYVATEAARLNTTPPVQEDDMPLTKSEKLEIADMAARAVIKALQTDQIRTPSTLVEALGETATRDDLLRAAALRTDDIRDAVKGD